MCISVFLLDRKIEGGKCALGNILGVSVYVQGCQLLARVHLQMHIDGYNQIQVSFTLECVAV